MIDLARQKRAQSETGIYHIMLRGINKQQVFFNRDDYNMFLDVLSQTKTDSGFKLFAYCIMNNHVHLLIKEQDEPIGKIFKRLGDRFIYWYNLKYDRVGGIFQGRFKSIPVNTDEYFISVLRYIHQNPVKAGLVKSCSEYEFSSYNSYFKPVSFVDTGYAIELIGIREFERIHKEAVTEKHLDIGDEQKIRVTDEEAIKIIEKITYCSSPQEFQRIPFDKQNGFIKELRKEGLTIRQICLFTGSTYRRAQTNHY